MGSELVDFFFVGFPKSGSTTFYSLLRSHPEIATSEIKEIDFFNTDFILEARKHLGKNYFSLIKTAADYAGLFDKDPQKIRGDFTPINVFSDAAPLNIYEYNNAARIIISIREPVSFLRSYHFQSLYNMIEDEPDFMKALSLEESRLNGRNVPVYCANLFYLLYSGLIDYMKYIKKYVDVFGREHVKVILFDDIMVDEYAVYQELLRFLNVNNLNFFPETHDRNPNHSLRFPLLRKFLLYPPVKKFFYENFPAGLRPLGVAISQRMFKKVQEKPHVSVEDLRRLKFQFKPKVEELNNYLNEAGLVSRNIIELWKY